MPKLSMFFDGCAKNCRVSGAQSGCDDGATSAIFASNRSACRAAVPENMPDCRRVRRASDAGRVVRQLRYTGCASGILPNQPMQPRYRGSITHPDHLHQQAIRFLVSYQMPLHAQDKAADSPGDSNPTLSLFPTCGVVVSEKGPATVLGEGNAGGFARM